MSGCVALLNCGMATQRRTIDYLLEQSAGAGEITAKPMFGEFGLYIAGKMIGSVCDDQLFLKPTPGGRAIASDADDAAPYPGAKPQMLIEADRWEDTEWLCELFRVTVAELPTPKPKKPRTPA